MITTAEKRKLHPKRYAKKDARNRIYRAVYGPSSGHDPQSRPELNEYRKRPQDWNVDDARETLFTFWKLAEFPTATKVELLSRLKGISLTDLEKAETR